MLNSNLKMDRDTDFNLPLPKITLVTPVFNGERFLKALLTSVREQHYPNLEYIVCDGGSSDGTLEILKANRDIITHLIVGKDKGMYDALAKGFARATGEIFGWIGCDDLLMPWCLNTMVSFMKQTPGCQWVTGIPAMFDEKSRLLWMAQVAPQYRRAWIRHRWYSPVGLGIIQQECTFFTRNLYENAGGLAQFSGMRMAGDFNLWCRFAEHAELYQTGVLLAGFRKHGHNISDDKTFYIDEANAVRIPGGKFIGYTYSYLNFLWNRFFRTQRLADLLSTNKT
jgi:glycosyltransferase involved in cell wall biosynthesis